jgi:hypothetical protein
MHVDIFSRDVICVYCTRLGNQKLEPDHLQPPHPMFGAQFHHFVAHLTLSPPIFVKASMLLFKTICVGTSM